MSTFLLFVCSGLVLVTFVIFMCVLILSGRISEQERRDNQGEEL